MTGMPIFEVFCKRWSFIGGCFFPVSTFNSHAYLLSMTKVFFNTPKVVLYSNSVAATISNTGKIAKMVHPDFFGKDVDKNTHHSDSEN